MMFEGLRDKGVLDNTDVPSGFLTYFDRNHSKTGVGGGGGGGAENFCFCGGAEPSQMLYREEGLPSQMGQGVKC